MLYVRADITQKLLSTGSLPMEGFYVEKNLQKRKNGCYVVPTTRIRATQRF